MINMNLAIQSSTCKVISKALDMGMASDLQWFNLDFWLYGVAKVIGNHKKPYFKFGVLILFQVHATKQDSSDSSGPGNPKRMHPVPHSVQLCCEIRKLRVSAAFSTENIFKLILTAHNPTVSREI